MIFRRTILVSLGGLIVFLLVSQVVFARSLTHFYYRAGQNEIKLTFKFDGPVSWQDAAPRSHHIAVDVIGATNRLHYPERPLTIRPLNRIILREIEGKLRLWVDVEESVAYQVYEEAGGTLLSIIVYDRSHWSLRKTFLPPMETLSEVDFTYQMGELDFGLNAGRK